MKPLLSICVSTYNRPLWLRSSLLNWLPQVKRFQDQIEFIVSDDASEGETGKVIEEAKGWGPFIYNRNPTNIGALKNAAKLVNLAHGEFVWILGDDDIPRSGVIQRVIEVLKNHPSIKYIIVNYTHWASARPPTEPVCPDSFNLMPTEYLDLNSGPVEKISDLVEGSPSCFTSTFSSVWHASLIKDMFNKKVNSLYTSMEECFIHSVYVADNMLNMPAYYIGYPYLINSHDVTWKSYMPIIHIQYMQELLQRFIDRGISRSIIAKHQRYFLRIALYDLLEILKNKNLPQRSKFSFLFFVKQNWRYREFYVLLLKLWKELIKSFLLRVVHKSVQSAQAIMGKKEKTL